VNPAIERFWVIDYRLYDRDGDGQSKLDHVAAMLAGVVHAKSLPFRTVLMDTWYASQKLMAQIDTLGKIYYCPVKCNRLVDDSQGARPYRRVEALEWDDQALDHGKLIKIRGFPKDKKVKLFRVTVSNHRTDFIVTNDLTQNSTDAVQQESGVRWRIVACFPQGAVSSGTQTVDRSRSLSVSQSPYPTKPHCLCLARLDETQGDCLLHRTDRLSN